MNAVFVDTDSWMACADRSFAIMRELRLTTVITTDAHFSQVGFDVLPATRPRKPRTSRSRLIHRAHSGE